MLAAVTSKLTMDVSPVPFLWVAPLTIYLGSLVVCFSIERFAQRQLWFPVSGLFLLASGFLISQQGHFTWLTFLSVQFFIHLGTLAAVCMVCHGELIRLKPDVVNGSDLNDRTLTDFYQIMALGGAVGGLFTAVIAPLVFPFYVEYHVALLASAILPIWAVRKDVRLPHQRRKSGLKGIVSIGGISLLCVLLLSDFVATWRNSFSISRSFFGVSRVIEHRAPGSQFAGAYELYHGTTRHGLQFTNPDLAKYPTTYYGPTSGVGLTIQSHHSERPKRIGIVGLGIGTLAAYGRHGDVYDFYEIDPVV
ncbi:MAG: hypothetical protein FJ267_15250, partial [Planctomycetes bacterium]|nr:hypothetical protein [Planctomycetota bacterium]